MAASGAESSVRLPGIVLSSLMFQHLNRDSDVEGLILGESITINEVTINDIQADNIHIEEIYNIQKHIACQKLQSFYSSTGEVYLNALKKLVVDSNLQSVIGWYRQRRNSEQQMTLREKIIHKNLKNTLSNPHMIFLLLTPSKFTSSGSTHKTEYAAYILRNKEAINVPVLVNNLGLLEPVSYCRVPALCSAVGYNRTMKTHRSKFFSSNGVLNEVKDINSMNDSLQSELQSLCRDVENSEMELEALQTELSALRKKVNEQKQSRLIKEPSPPPKPKRNTLLHKAVKALFACSPLFQSQTLTTSAFPILDFVEDTPATQQECPMVEDMVSELLQRNRATQKRPREIPQGNDCKRKKI